MFVCTVVLPLVIYCFQVAYDGGGSGAGSGGGGGATSSGGGGTGAVGVGGSGAVEGRGGWCVGCGAAIGIDCCCKFVAAGLTPAKACAC